MRFYPLSVRILTVLLFTQLYSNLCKGQIYGLGFYSHDVMADQRTTLNLFPDKGFNSPVSFQMSFEMSFLPDQADYFGYIFRIIENDKRNIDLVYNRRYLSPMNAGDQNHFKLVIGEQYSKIKFDVAPKQLISQWNKITLDFDYDNDQLILHINGREFTEKKIELKKSSVYKITFGMNQNPGFKNSDCSAMKIRNVKITTGNVLKYFWPLDEVAGNTANEVVSNTDGQVINPMWIKAQHSNWALAKSVHINGLSNGVRAISNAAFNPENNMIYIIGRDSIWNISANNFQETAIGYRAQELNLLPSSQSVYNTYDHTLYNFYIDNTDQTLSTFNFSSKQWSRNYSYTPAVDYWHSNSFFSSVDTCLYVIGGYGRMTYKNTVYRCHLSSGKWERVETKGDTYCPRYLAACGTTNGGDAAYLLGGYGSATGDQMLNSKNLYDLIKFDVKTRTFKKIYELKTTGEGFVFANRMVIDEKNQTFSALVFPNQKFNTQIQLLTGSLLKPQYQFIGSKIPFNFHDIRSTAQLFYSPVSQKLLAVTSFRPNDQQMDYRIYSLLSPPDNTSVQPTAVASRTGYYKYILIAFAVCLCGISVWYYSRKKRAVYKTWKHDAPAAIAAAATLNYNPEDIPTGHQREGRFTIYLFGDLKLYLANGEDVTGQFTSLVKELFILVMIYTFRRGGGISPEKLIEVLWPDKSDLSARNNRSANISKLKNLLGQFGYINVSKDTRNWKIEINFEHVYVDFKEYLDIVSHKKTIDKNKIMRLAEITKRGSLLQSTDYPWLDQIKSEISNEIIDIYLSYAVYAKQEGDTEFLIELADAIFHIDSVNEEAMEIKCKALSVLGKHSLAKSTFESFNKEFRALYGEDFKVDFNSVVHI